MMKKLIICFSFVLVALTIAAQETATENVLLSKKGVPVLPQNGDWSIGANAAPYLRYLGNIFNNTSGNTLTFSENTLYGRYFLSDKSALRITVYMNNENEMSRGLVNDDTKSGLDANAKIEDTRKVISTNNYFDLGYMKFRGYGRLLGFYGVHAGFGFGRDRTIYEYGNSMTTANSNPTSVDWDNYYSSTSITSINPANRLLEYDNGISKTVSAGLLAGVEFYFAPKMCIGTEIALNAVNTWKSQGNSKSQHVVNTIVEEYDVAVSPKGRTNTTISTRYAANYGSTFSLYLMFTF